MKLNKVIYQDVVWKVVTVLPSGQLIITRKTNQYPLWALVDRADVTRKD